MPNHSDVRAYFHGEPDRLAALLGACRQQEMRPSAIMGHWSSELGRLDWDSLPADVRMPPKPMMDTDGVLPPKGSEAPFSLEVGIPMPDSLLGVDSWGGELASEILTGRWTHALGPRHEGLRQCSTQQEALAWIEAAEPGSIDAGRRRLDNETLHGAPTWYGWCILNWGTKWDAYDTAWADPQMGGRLQLVAMQTAWSPPLPALAAMCRRFGLSCCCSYIEDGCGDSDFAIIEPDGSMAIGGTGLGSKAHAAAKRSARARLALAAPVPRSRKPKADPMDWPSRMNLGLPLGPGHFGVGCPAPKSPEAAERVVDALSPGSPALAAGAAALDELAARGIVSPSTALPNGVPLGLALASSLWMPGADWALRQCDEALRPLLASAALARALEFNAPTQAAWAWGKTPAALRPGPKAPLLAAALEACIAIGDADPSARAELAPLVAQGVGSARSMGDERQARLRAMLDRWGIEGCCAPAPKSSRPRI